MKITKNKFNTSIFNFFSKRSRKFVSLKSLRIFFKNRNPKLEKSEDRFVGGKSNVKKSYDTVPLKEPIGIKIFCIHVTEMVQFSVIFKTCNCQTFCSKSNGYLYFTYFFLV